jgi:hypothetical protein
MFVVKAIRASADATFMAFERSDDAVTWANGRAFDEGGGDVLAAEIYDTSIGIPAVQAAEAKLIGRITRQEKERRELEAAQRALRARFDRIAEPLLDSWRNMGTG